MKIDSRFAILDVLGPDGELYELYKVRGRGEPTRVVVHGEIVGIWGGNDGTSREFHVEVNRVIVPETTLAVETEKASYCFVLNGWVNGEEGLGRAQVAGPSNGPVLEDGWYWLVDGDADGEGPYETREKAEEAYNARERT